MSYTFSPDTLCYANSTVLKNHAGLRSQSALDAFELEMFLSRAVEPWPSGNLNSSHYLALHRHLFQDVYEWAGHIRTIRIGKSGVWFCYPEHIPNELERLFASLVERRYFCNLSPSDFAGVTAHFLAELNAIHPFREGNGRCQMAFLAVLTDNAGLPFKTEVLIPERAMNAMIESFQGRLRPLEALIREIVSA